MKYRIHLPEKNIKKDCRNFPEAFDLVIANYPKTSRKVKMDGNKEQIFINDELKGSISPL